MASEELPRDDRTALAAQNLLSFGLADDVPCLKVLAWT